MKFVPQVFNHHFFLVEDVSDAVPITRSLFLVTGTLGVPLLTRFGAYRVTVFRQGVVSELKLATLCLCIFQYSILVAGPEFRLETLLAELTQFAFTNSELFDDHLVFVCYRLKLFGVPIISFATLRLKLFVEFVSL